MISGYSSHAPDREATAVDRGRFQYLKLTPLAVTLSAACTPKGKVMLPRETWPDRNP